MMKVDLPGVCPHCSSDITVTAFECGHCGAQSQGSFRPCPFCRLDAHDNVILFSFLAARGNLKEMEKELGLSYPTLRSRLDALLDRLGVRKRKPRVNVDKQKATKGAIADLAAGEITVLEALERIRKGEIDTESRDEFPVKEDGNEHDAS